MENITNSAELKKAIQVLEVEQYVSSQEIKAQVLAIFESFKAINIIKRSLKDIASSPLLTDNLLGTAVSLATGYFSNKLLLGVSTKILRILFSPLLKLGIKTVVSHAPISVKSIGQSIIQHFTGNKQSPTQS